MARIFASKGSGNDLLQHRTYSLHKGRALIKPMMFVSTDGYIISAIGPHFVDTQNNDASITKQIFLTNSENINDWLQPNDLLIVDRGFRYCLQFLENLGLKTKMSAVLNKAEKVFSAQEANEGRFITKIRWVVGKRKWAYQDVAIFRLCIA